MRSGCLILLPLLSLLPLIAEGSDLQGHWVGVWEREGNRISISMDFTRAGEAFSGSFDSEGLRAVGIPLQEIRYSPPRVTWKIVGDATTFVFEGEIHGDEMKGAFREDGAAGSFDFRRSERSSETPIEEPFHFASGGIKLAGTLVLPRTKSGRFPAVVFLQGSGAEGRWASRYLAFRFAQSGIAGLIYDKRGVGESEGDWRDSGFSDLVDDVVAAVAAIRKDARIDPARVGIHGHSQGGTISPWVASRIPDLCFVIGSAAAGLPMDRVEIYSIENSIGIASLPPEEADLARHLVRALVQSAYHGAPREPVLELAEKAKAKSWIFEIPPPESSYWKISRKIADFDPIPFWKTVRCPVLLLYGDQDERVPPRESASRIAEALLQAGCENLTIHVFPKSGHTFRIVNHQPEKFSWPQTSPGYPEIMIDWVRQIVAKPAMP